MFTVLFTLAVVALIAFGFWWSQRGQESTVRGSGNHFAAYYGKGRPKSGQSPPCDACIPYGCIGAGECRCACHRASSSR